MNVDIVARIRPSLNGEGAQDLSIDGFNKIARKPGATYYSFQQIHTKDATNYEVYKQNVEPLVDLWVAGYNTCLIVTGESISGKHYTFAGEKTSDDGLVPLIFENLYAKINEGSFLHDSSSHSSKKIDMQMFEIHNELITDLLRSNHSSYHKPELEETPAQGVFVNDIKILSISRAQEGITEFRQAMSRTSKGETDYGPASNHATIMLRLDLTLKNPDSDLLNRSRMTVVLTSGAEKLAEDVSQLRLREGPVLSKSIMALNELSANLSNQQHPDRNIGYSESLLTQLLHEEIGGNCRTRVIFCLQPVSNGKTLGPILRFAGQLSRVQNYPILNDPFAQQLCTQYRARIQQLQSQLGVNISKGSHSHDLTDSLRRVQSENLELRDKTERLQQKLQELQDRYGSVAKSKMEMSSHMLSNEEDKLKVSKTLVEMQIENNRIREEGEAAGFELTNKILQLESALMQAEADSERHMISLRNARDKVSELEQDRKELADEYVVLKTNYLNTRKAYERVQERNEELGTELVNQVNTKAAIMRQYEKRNIPMRAQEEVDRMMALVSRLSTHTLRPEDFGNRDEVEKTLFGGERQHKSEINRLNHTHTDEQKRLERRLTTSQKELSDTRELTRVKQHNVSELNAQLITARNQIQSVESQNNRLQHKLKDVNDEFRSRLVKYVHDIADFVDNGGVPGSNPKEVREMKSQVDAMLNDLKRSHKLREDQLSAAAQRYRHLAENTAHKHEQLLVAYRDLRQQVEDAGIEGMTLGPSEHSLHMSEQDLSSKQQLMINRLREEINRTNSELKAVKTRLQLGNFEGSSTQFMPGKGNSGESVNDDQQWHTLRKQLREFSVNTQQELEQERADLMSKNAMMEQEISDLQAYIETHLSRYRDEILRLREAAGMQHSGGFVSPGGPLRHMRNHRR